MAANAGVVEAIVSLYCIDSDTTFERHSSRMPINDVNTVHSPQKTPCVIPWTQGIGK